MNLRIDHSIAEKNLLKAFHTTPEITNGNAKCIAEILNGSHKTYKYILVTALLAKSCSEKVNPLALQSGAPITGAYDARSLCHKVIVPFERNFLYNALGGSNEPFLNKPARFTHLSTNNAVRAGKDKNTLETLIKVLSNIKTEKESLHYLSYALKIIIEIADEQTKLNHIEGSFNPELIEVYDYIVRFIDESYEGESCTIVIGTLEKIYHLNLKGNYKVICHKVNQSGASSKEIGDIDVFSEGKYCYSIEVKDKNFNVYDIEHAFNKIIENKGLKGAFVYGPRATYDSDSVRLKLFDYQKKKFFTLFIDIYTYSKIMLFHSKVTDKNLFIKILMETANEINCKNVIKERIHELLKTLNWHN